MTEHIESVQVWPSLAELAGRLIERASRLRSAHTNGSNQALTALGRATGLEEAARIIAHAEVLPQPFAMIPVGASVFYGADGTLLDASLRARVVEHVEGWYMLAFLDGSRAIVRPSHVLLEEPS